MYTKIFTMSLFLLLASFQLASAEVFEAKSKGRGYCGDNQSEADSGRFFLFIDMGDTEGV